MRLCSRSLMLLATFSLLRICLKCRLLIATRHRFILSPISRRRAIRESCRAIPQRCPPPTSNPTRSIRPIPHRSTAFSRQHFLGLPVDATVSSRTLAAMRHRYMAQCLFIRAKPKAFHMEWGFPTLFSAFIPTRSLRLSRYRRHSTDAGISGQGRLGLLEPNPGRDAGGCRSRRIVFAGGAEYGQRTAAVQNAAPVETKAASATSAAKVKTSSRSGKDVKPSGSAKQNSSKSRGTSKNAGIPGFPIKVSIL